jgi:hypothetical protein
VSRQTERQRAKALNVPSASDLVYSTVPYAMNALTDAQIDQVQRVLDAAVVNPAVEKEAADTEYELRHAEMRYNQRGEYTYAEPTVAERLRHRKDGLIPVKESDKHIRLDHRKLFTREALKPRTDNPDEAAYLLDVLATLDARGVWFRFGMKSFRDPNEPSNWIDDPRAFDAWLSLGYDGDRFKSGAGALSRDSLLDNTTLGAGYWKAVDQGPVRTMLRQAIDHLNREIEAGRRRHFEIGQIRRRAVPGTVWVSDKAGGARYPEEKIWDALHSVMLVARNLSVDGNVEKSMKHVVVAALVTSVAAKSLNDYIDGFIRGAERFVNVLNVVRTAGKIAEIILMVRWLGMIVVRRLGAEAAATGLGGSGGARAGEGAGTSTRAAEPAAIARSGTAPDGYANARSAAKAAANARTAAGTAENARSATAPDGYANAALANTAKQLGVELDGASGSVGRAWPGYDAATQQRIDGFYADYMSYLNANHDAPFAEKMAAFDRVAARWGSPGAFLP